jgi:hypothetical protein
MPHGVKKAGWGICFFAEPLKAFVDAVIIVFFNFPLCPVDALRGAWLSKPVWQ